MAAQALERQEIRLCRRGVGRGGSARAAAPVQRPVGRPRKQQQQAAAPARLQQETPAPRRSSRLAVTRTQQLQRQRKAQRAQQAQLAALAARKQKQQDARGRKPPTDRAGALQQQAAAAEEEEEDEEEEAAPQQQQQHEVMQSPLALLGGLATRALKRLRRG